MITKVKILGYRIYRNLTLEPNRRLNLIAGANESGKSTLMEAIALALTGRINGRTASEELNPYWFNTALVAEFVQQLAAGIHAPWPEIRIELFLENRDDLQQLCGAINSDVPTNACPGISMRVLPDPDYAAPLGTRRYGSVTRLVSMITVAFASARPFRLVPAPSVMVACARMLPWNEAFVAPRVADVPTCQ